MASSNTVLFETGAEWLAEARRRNIAHKSIKTCSDLRSGSKVTEEQFLLFRTLVPSVEHRFDPNVFGLAAQYSQAAGPGLPTCQWNGDRIPLEADFGAPAGSFIAVTDGQLQNITRKWNIEPDRSSPVDLTGLPTSQWNGDRIPLRADFGGPAGSFIAVTDGQLQDITNNWNIEPDRSSPVVGLPTCQWNGDRIPLEADFGGPAGSFIAVTDGQLQAVTDKRILALVECKRWERDRHSPQVEVQETAQMVAWIKEFPDTATRPW
ncbi:hypothetical protein C8Q69DRAFT_503212 [Paecilomyces variotii]|uniref:Uncharacterized protein n=1 Tax=Byssochlamys spectabilis TaxID=264951 RepID=A0A443I6M3_BYSSP|nr:hypothetical protein C8Q69DRAFT_503212 [Paecilomyces variotii]RWQ99691.1 hypothetical protein C8Q69DRAFT_503212 [Paecilomyces variotii]